MRWWILLIVLLLAQGVSALEFTACPESAEQYESFTLTVTHPGATRIGLFHDGAWDNRSGSTVSYTLEETQARDRTYYANAEVSGAWLADGPATCTVSITASDQPGDVRVSSNASSVVAGGSVLITAEFEDLDGTKSIRILAGGTSIKTRTCPTGSTSCDTSVTHTPSTATTYTAEAFDMNNNEASGETRVTVTNPAPVVSLNAAPLQVRAGESVTFSGTISDNAVVPSVKLTFGDGSSEMISCTAKVCDFTKSHSYSQTGAYLASLTATDSGGLKASSAVITISVSAPSDADGDSIPDVSDTCPGTQGEVAVTSGSYLGCSCNQIVQKVPNPADDGLPCTEDTCSISGSFSAQHPPKPNGAQPAGYSDGCTGTSWNDYSCQNGAVSTITTTNAPQCISCTPDTSRSCWNNNVHSYDSCGNRNPVPRETCSPTRYCQDAACLPYTFLLYDYSTNTQVSSIRASSGSTITIRPVLIPSADATFTMSGSDTVIGDYASIPVTGTIGNTETKTFVAKIGSTTIATQYLDINITCNKGDSCYCAETTTSGCITDGSQTPKSGYCTLGICGSCPANTFLVGGTCVQCTATDVSRCKADPYCQSASCNAGACQVTNKADNTACGAGFCSSGQCKGCTQKSCQPTIAYRNETTRAECKETTTTITITTTGLCASDICTPGTSTETPSGTTTKNLTGTPCSKGTCDNGICTETICLQLKTNPSLIDWEANHSTCNGKVTLCGQT